MREDNNTDILSNQRNDNSVDTFEQRVDHTVGSSTEQRIDHGSENTVVQPDDNDVVSDTQLNDHGPNPQKPKPVNQPETAGKENTPNFPWKVLFVIALIGFLIAVVMLIKNKIETNPDKGTAISVTAESSVSVSDETPFIDVTANKSISLTENTSKAAEIITTAKATEKFNSGELNDVINEIITTVKTTEKTVYTLTLDSNGGNTIIDPYKVAKGDSITLPYVQKNYNVFYDSNGGTGNIQSSKYSSDCTGWSKIKGSTYASYKCGISYTPTSNETLYAVWPSLNVLLTNTKPTRSGYEFIGWSENRNAASPEYASGDSVHITKETTRFYAIWKKLSYTLSYNANGGSGAPSSQTGSSSYIISSTQPTRAGYKFLGWSKNSSASSASYSTGNTITLSSNTTLYAIWEQITVRLESYNGSSRVNIHRTGTKINSSTVGWPVSLPTVKSNVTGESGSGWETVCGNLIIDGSTMYITQPGKVQVRYKLIYKGYAYYSEVYTYTLTLYKLTSDENFIRKSPGESSEKTGKHVPKNYEIEIQKFQVDPNGCHLWGYVDYNGAKGWITCLVMS